MEIGKMLVFVVVTLLFSSVCDSSRLLKDVESQNRRNLLANGLGKTPPMGYDIYHLSAYLNHSSSLITCYNYHITHKSPQQTIHPFCFMHQNIYDTGGIAGIIITNI